MELIKKNRIFILGISIPILMILFVVASIYVPGIFIKPKCNFVYTSGAYYGNEYSVVNNRITKVSIDQNGSSGTYESQGYQYPNIYLYDVINNTSSEISYQEARNISIDSSTKSQDGFEIDHGSSGGGFLPFTYNQDDYSSIYIKGNGVSKKLNLTLSDNDYYDFHLIGWVR